MSEILDGGDFYREATPRSIGPRSGLYARRARGCDHARRRAGRAGELEDVGGRLRVHELAALVPAAANAAHYARIVREVATLVG